jgi:hypothetical protein
LPKQIDATSGLVIKSSNIVCSHDFSSVGESFPLVIRRA